MTYSKAFKLKLYNFIFKLNTIQLKSLPNVFLFTNTISLTKKDKINILILIDFILSFYFKKAEKNDLTFVVELSNLHFQSIIDKNNLALYKQVLYTLNLIVPLNIASTNQCTKYQITSLLFDLINGKATKCVDLGKAYLNRLNKRKKEYKNKNIETIDLAHTTQTCNIDKYINYTYSNLHFDYTTFSKSIDLTDEYNAIMSNYYLNFEINKNISISDTNHRLYNEFTSTKKCYRKYFYVKNISIEKYSNIDLKCSQLSLFYSILQLIKVTEYHNFIFKSDIDEYNYYIIQNAIINNEKMYNDLTNIFICSKDIYIELFPSLERAKAKQKTFENFFSKRINLFENESINYFRNIFISKIQFKETSNTTDVYKHKQKNAQFAIFLQRVESYLFINCFINKAVDYNIFNFITLHDGIFIEKKNVELAMNILNNIFIETFGINHILKIETK